MGKVVVTAFTLDPTTQILPVNGSREALFAFAQTVVELARGTAGRGVICPNPFYQIYEGAALLAGATPYYAPSDPSRNFNINWDSIPGRRMVRPRSWSMSVRRVIRQGAVMPMSDWEKLFELSRRYGFVIASDECYSEIYFRDDPPLGGLEAAAESRGRRFQKPDRIHEPVEAQ